jgi:hypothetical protein
MFFFGDLQFMDSSDDLVLRIPAAIVALPGLNLSERIVLAQIAMLPHRSNASLAKLLGFSQRGAEILFGACGMRDTSGRSARAAPTRFIVPRGAEGWRARRNVPIFDLPRCSQS